METVLVDKLFLETNPAPLAPRGLVLLGLKRSQGKHHLDCHSQLILDVGLITPGGSDGISPLNVFWGCFDKEEEEDILVRALIWVVQQVAEVAEASGLLSWDGEALIDVGEAVDQVAIGV